MFNEYIDVTAYQAPPGDGITRYAVKSTSVVNMTRGTRVDYSQVI